MAEFICRLGTPAGEVVTRTVEATGVQEARARFAILDVAAHHRVGTLAIGAAAVVVAVAAPHRDAAFAGCRYVIDELKKRAPIWKKEVYRDGESWLSHCP